MNPYHRCRKRRHRKRTQDKIKSVKIGIIPPAIQSCNSALLGLWCRSVWFQPSLKCLDDIIRQHSVLHSPQQCIQESLGSHSLLALNARIFDIALIVMGLKSRFTVCTVQEFTRGAQAYAGRTRIGPHEFDKWVDAEVGLFSAPIAHLLGRFRQRGCIACPRICVSHGLTLLLN
jgi:hypothetical protein